MISSERLEAYFRIKGLCVDRIDYWSSLIQYQKLKSVAEIGVWKGDFAASMLERCESIREYRMIDPWAHLDQWNKPFNVDDNSFEAIRVEALNKTKFAATKIIEHRCVTTQASKSIPSRSIDFAYVDGDHTLRGIILDLISMLPKIVPGGVLVGDDFCLNPWQHSSEFEPTLVFPFAIYFAEAMGLPIYGVGGNQFLIHNDPTTGFKFTDFTQTYDQSDLNSLRDFI